MDIRELPKMQIKYNENMQYNSITISSDNNLLLATQFHANVVRIGLDELCEAIQTHYEQRTKV